MWTVVRIGVCIAGFAALLAPGLGVRRALLWSVLLGGAMALAIGAARQWYVAHRQMRLMDHATGLVEPRDGALVAVCGPIQGEGDPLRSPFFDEPAVAYQYTVHHTVQERRPQRTTTRRITDYAGFAAVPMSVRGSYVTARLGGFPRMHEFRKRDDAGDWLLELASQGGDEGRSEGDRLAALGEADRQRQDALRTRARDYLRSARFAPLPPDEMIEYVEWWNKDWDGRGRIARDHQREAGVEPQAFWEQLVAPGEPVCAVGVWSDASRALVRDGDRELVLYPGTPDQVKQIVGRHAGAGLLVALLLGAGSIAAAAFLIR